MPAEQLQHTLLSVTLKANHGFTIMLLSIMEQTYHTKYNWRKNDKLYITNYNA